MSCENCEKSQSENQRLVDAFHKLANESVGQCSEIVKVRDERDKAIELYAEGRTELERLRDIEKKLKVDLLEATYHEVARFDEKKCLEGAAERAVSALQNKSINWMHMESVLTVVTEAILGEGE